MLKIFHPQGLNVLELKFFREWKYKNLLLLLLLIGLAPFLGSILKGYQQNPFTKPTEPLYGVRVALSQKCYMVLKFGLI